MADSIELVVGLGNPGPRYVRTRHNAGFEVADELRRRRGRGDWLRRPECDLAVIVVSRLVVAARPLGFMNRSGAVAAGLLAELGLEPPNLLVVVDDVDLPLGALRLKASGGPGTHNGLRDICDCLGTGFPRLRLGVRGGGPIGDLAEYVLSAFDVGEVVRARTMVRRAADAAECAIREGLERAMNTYNRPAGTT